MTSTRNNMLRWATPRAVAAICVTALAIVASPRIVCAQGEDAPAPASTETANPAAPPLSVEQQRIAEQFRRFEEVILRMSELTAPTDPQRAALLRKAVARSKEMRLAGRFDELTKLLEERQLATAVAGQQELQGDLVSILQLLLSEERDAQLKSRREQIKEQLRRIQEILNEQRRLQGDTERASDPSRLAEEQGKTAEKTGELAEQMKEADRSALDRPRDAEEQDGDKQDGDAEKSDNGESKSQDGERQDGESSDSESKDSDAKDGESKESDSQRSEESKDGESRESQEGESNEGKPKREEGEAKESEDERKSDKAPEESDKNKRPDGERKQDAEKGDSKSEGEQQKSDGEPKSSKQSQQSPQPGEPQQSQDGESDSEESESQQPQNAQQRVEAARQRMRQAQQKLEKAEREGAVKEQEEAIRELEQAKAELEEILRQLREEEIARALEMLEARFRKMLEMQNEVYEGTARVNNVPEDQRGRGEEIEAGRLSRKEALIVVEAEKAQSLLREEGSAVAFPEAVDQLIDDMNQVVGRLAEGNVGEVTLGLEEDIIAALEEMIEAVKQARKDLEEKQQQQSQPMEGEPVDPPLVDKLAELRMIRSLQMRVNRRTERYTQLVEGDEVGQADKPELLEALRRLAEREDRIFQATRDLVLGKNE